VPVTDAETNVVVQPWYRQFYLRRGSAEWNSDKVSGAGYSRGLEAIDGFVYVGTTMYGSPTQITIRVHASNPGPPDPADRAAEVRLDGDGHLAVLNWQPGEAAVADVVLPTGPLLVRASWHGTAQAAAHPDYDLGGEDLSPERVVLDLWPA
jgi:hypothetical protein